MASTPAQLQAKAAAPAVSSQKVSYKKITRLLQKQAEGYTIVLFCNDQAGCKGTGNRSKWMSDRNMKQRGIG